MTDIPSTPRARPAPVMVLCRQCVQYVFAGTTLCPHCKRDARDISAAYEAGGHLAVEAMQEIDRLVQAAEERGRERRQEREQDRGRDRSHGRPPGA